LPGATIFEKLRSHRDQRDFISSGAAAGIAAGTIVTVTIRSNCLAFGAPIGGVLFALEEASSVWSRELTWRTFLGCMLSAFTVNLLFQSVSDGDSLVSDFGNMILGALFNLLGLLSFGISRDYLYRYQELNLFILLGVIGTSCQVVTLTFKAVYWALCLSKLMLRLTNGEGINLELVNCQGS